MKLSHIWYCDVYLPFWSVAAQEDHLSNLTHERRRDLSPQGHPHMTGPPVLATSLAPLAHLLVLAEHL